MAGREKPDAFFFVWEQFAPYHKDRLEALARALGADGNGATRVVGVEIADRSRTYAWSPATESPFFTFHSLFPGIDYEDVPARRRLPALLRLYLRYRPSVVFLCNYEHIEMFFLALAARVMRARVFIIVDSKFDDRPRALWREIAKSFVLKPYHGALVSGRRAREYFSFLGFREDRLFTGCDTISTERMRRSAAASGDEAGFEERHFTVIARHVPQKNLHCALDAYEIYRRLKPSSPRELRFCGSGEKGEELAAEVRRRGIEGVRFLGFLQAEEVARELNSTLALILPSTHEPWGLVVNEALALGVPVLCSDAVGARDTLVRTAVSGFVFEADNPEGLAHLMQRLSNDAEEWRRLAAGARRFAVKGDVGAFVAGVYQAAALSRRYARLGEPAAARR